ncbi:MAG: Asp-tRNA(Asn)/Glu-tRNA(Gln) amidotransferase subunit GatB [Actinomycetota bacterium]
MDDAFETVIGLECHVELSTRTKMFCGCPTTFGAPPNTQVCPVCLGLPGTLPVPNEAAIAAIVKIGLALGCRIAPDSCFHRKNYFYPDMPKDFQISQYDLPICVGGSLDIEVDGATRAVGITRVHMEEDTGKTTHAGESGRIGRADYALVDYNRAGVPLVEVVSEPDLRTPEEARAYLLELRAVLASLDVSDVRMEEGSLRCDANISVRRRGETAFGTRVEIKNLNSVRSLERALRSEEVRHREAIARGERIVQETRHYDEESDTTHSLRSKEEAFDYRYFPEPDIPRLAPEGAWIDAIRGSLPELPAARRARYTGAGIGLAAEQARVLVDDRDLAAFFDATLAVAPPVAPRPLATWITQNLTAALHDRGLALADAPLTPDGFADVVRLVEDGTVSATAGKQVLDAVLGSGRAAADVVEERGLRQVSDAGALEAWVDEVLAAHPDEVAAYRGGKQGLLGFFTGQVMQRSRGSANPKAVGELLRARLDA